MFPERLKALRKKNGWTQREAAEATGMSYRGLQDLEAGKKPVYDSLLKLADGFEVSVDYLMGRTDDPRLHQLDE